MSTSTINKPASTNPVAVKNRIAKARRLAAFVSQNKTTFDDLKPEEITPVMWKLVNKALGEKKAEVSPETIAMAVAILAERKFNA